MPDGLYTPEVRRSLQMLTVPACADCNGAKGRADNSLRDYLLIDGRSHPHPVAQEVFETKMKTAVATNRVRLLDRFYEGASVPRFSEYGAFRGMDYGIPIDFAPVQLALVYLVRGLHFAAFGEVKHDDEVEVGVLHERTRHSYVMGLANLGVGGSFVQGAPFMAFWSTNDAQNVRWLMIFYDRVGFAARSVPGNRSDNVVRPTAPNDGGAS